MGGNRALKARYPGCTVVGPAADAARIPAIDVQLGDGQRYPLGAVELTCYDVPGHTRGHVAYHCPAAKALFPGARCTQPPVRERCTPRPLLVLTNRGP